MYPVTSDSFLSAEFLAPWQEAVPKNKGPLFEVTYIEKYCRWRPEVKRREIWAETVQRVVEYSMSLYSGPASKSERIKEAEELFERVFNLKLLPAGRTLWIGGTLASKKVADANFNCAFRCIDELEALCDAFHLLLCGCGVGFSVERKYVGNLPELFRKEVINEDYNPLAPADRLEDTVYSVSGSTMNIAIGDSKEGWVQAFRCYLSALQTNVIKTVVLNYDSIRGEKERIKTFGGFAPGPAGLMEMFIEVNKVIPEAGKLRPIQVVDILNLIAQNVLIGGNRRAAEIAIGDADDREFIEAKWGNYPNHRQMSNNTVVYDKKPSKKEIADIFQRIMSNGEPGFFNRMAASRRRPNAVGLNPCLTSDTWIATSEGPRQIKDLRDNTFKAVVDNIGYIATPFWSSGKKEVYVLRTVEGYSLRLTKDHKMLTASRGWVEAGNLLPSDKIVINNLKQSTKWGGVGTFKEGWLLGSLVGDGTYANQYRAELRYWGQTRKTMAAQAMAFMKDSVEHRSDCAILENKTGGYLQVSSNGIGHLAERFGIAKGAKVIITPEIEKASSEFYKGFLQGIFDADGSAQGNKEKGCSVRLAQNNITFLKGIQRMLLRLGIKSVLHENRKPAGMYDLPNGKGGNSKYFCKEMSELIISRDSLYTYHKEVGFSEPPKQERLEGFISESNKRKLYTDRFSARFESLEFDGFEEVFDCTVSDVHCFDANGLIAHNCAEILLDSSGFCNLSTSVVSSHVVGGKLDLDDLLKSVRAATRIGLRMTNVNVTLPKWDANQKRDRLLGVSITGWMDALDKLGIKYNDYSAMSILKAMREAANEEATMYAFEMRVPRPLLVTSIKPEGTISQLPTVSSGLHRGYSPYFLRTFRISNNSPVSAALIEMGMPSIDDPKKKGRKIFRFPVKSETSIAQVEEPALDQFQRYLNMQSLYTDHNSSCTLSFSPEEVPALVDKIYDNWDNMIACAFLPKFVADPAIYPYMPYEAITKEQYENLIKNVPDLTKLVDVVHKLETTEFVDRDEEPEVDPTCPGNVCPVR